MADKKFKVVRLVRTDILGVFTPTTKEVKELAKVNAELLEATCNTEDEIVEAAKDADIILMGGARITRRVMEALPKCQAIIFGSVGFDAVDVGAATDNGIIITNHPSPQWCVEEVSNHAIILLLACAKKLVLLNNGTKQGRWAESKQLQRPMGTIHGQILGLVGCGSIGQMTAKKAQAFSLRILGYDPYVDKSLANEHGITLVSLPELLKESDFVSLHTILNDETRHMIGEEAFKQMKPDAYFINTSRGPVVDEPALIKALQEKWIAGAGLDVFEKEPVDPDNPLLKMDNVTVFPHSASYSDAAFKLPRIIMQQEALRIIRGHWPKNVVNKAVIPKVNLIKED
ncbi:C-terminal binding protein [Chloroflexota bacterium]